MKAGAMIAAQIGNAGFRAEHAPFALVNALISDFGLLRSPGVKSAPGGGKRQARGSGGLVVGRFGSAGCLGGVFVFGWVLSVVAGLRFQRCRFGCGLVLVDGS